MQRIGRALLGAAALAAPALALAAPFDVETATRAYLDTLQGAARAKSDAYFEGGYWLILWGAVFGIAVDWLLLDLRLTARFRSWGEQLSKRRGIVILVTAACYAFAAALLMLPWTIYTGFVRERQYGLMNLDFGGWLGEFLTSFAIDMLVLPLLVLAVYVVIRRAPRTWWLWGTGIAGIFLLVGLVLSPVFIAPLFNTYSELEPGPVRDRIVGLAKAQDIPADHIFVFDASKQTKRISANVSGLGPTIRISLNDNLLKRASLPEIADVMGHEMGHYKLGHVWWIFGVMLALVATGLFLVSRIAPRLIARFGERWGVRDIADPASLPVLSILLTVFFTVATPVTNSLIRINESKADAFGLDTAREPDGFASIAMKLSEYRKIEPGPIEEALFFDHPSGATRVRMAMQWKKDHVSGAQIVTPAPISARPDAVPPGK
jgi:STE24 endopeptidase